VSGGPATGRVALHGGGEFLAGDEPFLEALLATVSQRPVKVAIVPVAAARSRPDIAVHHGRQAFEAVAHQIELELEVDEVLVVDRESAFDETIAARLARSNLIHLPGGDPDLVPGTLAGTTAWQAILDALGHGATLAGASAGAMGLADRTWTPRGWIDGLGLVHGLIVVPHFRGFDTRGWEGAVDELRRANLGQLGLDERTGVISGPGLAGEWLVAGEGEAHWFSSAGERTSGKHGDHLALA
jgi:cyanophycinase-like exopeptidase